MDWRAGLLAGAFFLAAGTASAAGKTLQPFADEGELVRFLAALEAKTERRKVVFAPPPPAPGASEDSTVLDRIEVTGSRISPQDLTSITNVQTIGVDEGDIVKTSGGYLIVLRRGRLFTLRIAGDALQPVAHVDAYAPGSDPDNTWYDEMLVSGRTVVVIGYSYERGGTEIGLFDLDAAGGLRHRDTFHMRSSDYYSAHNYASRLIGRKLIFYTPLPVQLGEKPDEFVPVLRRWHVGATPQEFKRILPAERIYRPTTPLDPDEDIVLHTVTTCDLDAPGLSCDSNAVLGPDGRVFYVSQDAVYVWATPWEFDKASPNASFVVRMPLDASAPTGVRASGSPIDQMSLLERDGYLNALVGSEADGEGMWASNSQAGELALLRLPLALFGDGSVVAARDDYRALPPVSEGHYGSYGVVNRFVGDWLVYGGNSWRGGHKSRAHALRFASPGAVQALRLGHEVERIDALRRDAILVGPAGRDLRFTSVRLDQDAVAVSGYVQPDATQGDSRTHGFFYRPTDENEGIVGLPILGFDEEGDSSAASVLYLQNRALRLRQMGRLDSSPGFDSDDGCKASCVDWYGNARPIFLGERVFALMGYELVEGRITADRIVERRRVGFAPK